jgi:hypothetical protein
VMLMWSVLNSTKPAFTRYHSWWCQIWNQLTRW